ncbi:HNH endonuclease signature motif containing protein [Desulfobacula sp.]|uniref:HNH endonuclease n=1 Tax=Desulfobacula sp. TaxID=2593537 RepID=UPI0025C155AB|nr:HNH endonuclease signature motif containing protein [Desulfobacula sp.]MBC2705663.1 HNH endonuclease [Desulfobacula sp.]
MKNNLKEFRFFETYETASWLEHAVTSPDTFIELPWEDDDVRKSLCKYSKVSVLEQYIFSMLAVEKRISYRKNIYDLMPDDIAEFKSIFSEYGIELRNENSFNPFGDEYDEYDHFYLWFEYQEDSFVHLWEQITEEVFHLLFSNRGFLLDFNKSLSTYIENNSDIVPANYRNDNGKIKRASNLPAWVKKAVFFRDQGRCVFCHKDLSGLLSTDRVIHYDHMVPLNRWGVNDPSNIQLLCEECNLKKGGNHLSTSTRYKEWW